MDDHEWWKCHGKLMTFYEIYRTAGPGPIQVGGFIGKYYPHALSLHQLQKVHLSWNSNLAALVFVTQKVVGAGYYDLCCGKGLDDVMEEHDYVILYYLQEGSWVSQNRYSDFSTSAMSLAGLIPQIVVISKLTVSELGVLVNIEPLMVLHCGLRARSLSVQRC